MGRPQRSLPGCCDFREVAIVTSRFDQHARAWNVSIDRTLETESSVLGFGTRAGQPVVLKVLRAEGDEWHSGAVLHAFAGNGAVRVYQHAAGAALLERLSPGTSLAELSLSGRDEEATDVLCAVMEKLWRPSAGPSVTVEDWGQGFDRYIENRHAEIPADLAAEAHAAFTRLSATQQSPVLLHGDLQHYNVLYDETRGWLAIDPKGVVGEREYEIGAALRNPNERFAPFAAPAVIQRRVQRFQDNLNLDGDRILKWSFAQAVLSAIWSIEDGVRITPSDPGLLLARAIHSILGNHV